MPVGRTDLRLAAGANGSSDAPRPSGCRTPAIAHPAALPGHRGVIARVAPLPDIDVGAMEAAYLQPRKGQCDSMSTPSSTMATGLAAVVRILEIHHSSFYTVAPIAAKTGHTVPSDTKSWSEILVSLLTGWLAFLQGSAGEVGRRIGSIGWIRRKSCQPLGSHRHASI